MKQMEVFFDYACPYCNIGIRQFLEILPDYPHVEIIWRPCEAHPLPEFSLMHSNLAIQAMYALRDAGGDLPGFHRRIYDAWFNEGKRIDDLRLLAGIAADCGGDEEEILQALLENRYAGQVEAGNDYAWDEIGLCAVPSYRCDGRIAGSCDGVLVPLRDVRSLMEE